MILEGKDIKYRKATQIEIKELLDKDITEVKKFLAKAQMMKDHDTIFALVEGVAFPIKELALMK